MIDVCWVELYFDVRPAQTIGPVSAVKHSEGCSCVVKHSEAQMDYAGEFHIPTHCYRPTEFTYSDNSDTATIVVML